jgi:predicted HAD superfamily phosphohydrolase YqeG
MRADYQQFSDQDELLSCVAELSPKTVILDVEPLVALWNTGTPELSGGVERLANKLSAIGGIKFLGFVTNSRRRTAVTSQAGGPSVFYVSSAHKPLLIQRYRDLPRPGAVIGDQLATDGIFAWRLGFDFLHYNPGSGESPTGVRIMNLTGNLLRPLFFNATAHPRPADKP